MLPIIPIIPNDQWEKSHMHKHSQHYAFINSIIKIVAA